MRSAPMATTAVYTGTFDSLTSTAPDIASRKSMARRAGLLYLLQCLHAPFALIYVPGRLLVAGNPSATADRIRASVTLLRLAIACELVIAVMVVFSGMALYRLFRDVDRRLALATALLMWVAVPIQMLNVVNDIAPLILTSGTTYLSAFTKEQVDALAYLFFRLHARGIDVVQIFAGLWLFPWGVAAMRSGWIPRWIGAAIIVAGIGYVLTSAVALLMPQYAAITPFLLALGVGEVPMN